MKTVRVGKIKIGADSPLVLIAGPCVIESEAMALSCAGKLKSICDGLKVPFIFKASYDKANRLSGKSFRGPGIKKGLNVLKRVKKEIGVPVLSDVHCREEVKEAAGVLDVIQIPAFLCRQTDLLVAAAKTGKPVNIKKGQFMAPWDIIPVLHKVESQGNKNILITERGVSFGYNNLVVDLRSLAVLSESGYPVIFDATHSVQLPGGRGDASSGQRQYVAGLSRAAVAFGCNGLFLEVHPDPDSALCDAANMISLNEVKHLLSQVIKINEALKCA
ncbi:MAG: 3-deoxy-8-phosphooctulonate synthase [Candidatus Omnitrophica bacterium]|nr:3-deoxy-8-phosphooctulonate synthase [Candidatus Omnitrophota bacterium]